MNAYHNFGDWLVCPGCGSDDVRFRKHQEPHGPVVSLKCRDCGATGWP